MQSRLVCGALVAATWMLAPALSAQGDAAARESCRSIQQEYDEALKKWNEAYRAAVKAGAGKDELGELRSSRPDAASYATRIGEILATDPASADSGAGAAWMISRAYVRGESFDRALAALAEHHAGSEHAEAVLSTLTRSPGPNVTRFLDRQLAACKGDRRALACMSLGEHLKYASGIVRRLAALEGKELERYVGYYGREAVDVLKGADADEYERRAIAQLERVVNDEAMAAVPYRGKTLGELARSTLFELRNLAIGKVAPDIVAEDIDGVPMKLSDYRGKVVVLDFWGDW